MSQLPWTEAQWARVQAAVTDEFTKSSVAGAALPCYGPLEGGVESVPGQFLVEDGAELKINDHDSVRLVRVNVYVDLSGQQVNDPNLTTALYAMRRAANRLARIEDDIIFNGYSNEEGNPVRLPNPLNFSKAWVRSTAGRSRPELYNGVDVSAGIRKVGLLSAGYDSADNAKALSKSEVKVVPSDAPGSKDHFVQAREVMFRFKRKVADARDLSAKYWPSADKDLRDVYEKDLISATEIIKEYIPKYAASVSSDLEGPLVEACGTRAGTGGRQLRDNVTANVSTLKASIQQGVAAVNQLAPGKGKSEKENQRILLNALLELDKVVAATENCLFEIEENIRTAGHYSEDSHKRSENISTRYGENLVSAVSGAISVLESSGYPGPFTCVFSPWMFDEAHRPHGSSLVLPADRITPMLGGPLLRAGLMVDGFGAVVATGEESIDIVVATPPKVQFMQITVEAKYRFRVYERFTLRVKDPRAVQLLMLER